MQHQSWVKLPTGWIESGGLKSFGWAQGQGSTNVAALLLLFPLAHFTKPETRWAHLTYNDFQTATGLSRTKISDGLKRLKLANVLELNPEHRSQHRLIGYGEEDARWGKLPAKRLYTAHGELTFRKSLFMRSVAELDALKVYFTFVTRRDNDLNAVYLTYDKITEYTGIPRNRIKPATSWLAGNGLISMENIKSQQTDLGTAIVYRVTHVDPYKHMGSQAV